MHRSPIIDPDFKRQVINYVVVDEFLSNKTRYTQAVSQRLQEYKIRLGQSEISQVKNGLLRSKRIMDFPTIFTGKIRPRAKKDRVYARFFGALDVFLPDKKDRHYLGLAAEQIGVYGQEFLGSLTSCEIDPIRYQWIKAFNKTFCKRRHITVLNENIFSVMERRPKRANIIDLDLMCMVSNTEQLQAWCSAIAMGAMDKTFVSVTTMIGRTGPTEQEYHKLMTGPFISLLSEAGFSKVNCIHRGGYCESSPMRFEFLCLER